MATSPSAKVACCLVLMAVALGGCGLVPTPEWLSMEKYQQLQIGMSYEQVVAIIGAPGVENATSADHKIYQWTIHSACCTEPVGVLMLRFNGDGSALQAKSQRGPAHGGDLRGILAMTAPGEG